jgi:hypothetical protein
MSSERGLPCGQLPIPPPTMLASTTMLLLVRVVSFKKRHPFTPYGRAIGVPALMRGTNGTQQTQRHCQVCRMVICTCM